MTLPRHVRALGLLRERGTRGLVSAHPATVTWLTGYASDFEPGLSSFCLNPVVVLSAEGELALIADSNVDSGRLLEGVRLHSYGGDQLVAMNQLAEVKRILAEVAGRGPLLVETGSIPHGLLAEIDVVDDRGELEACRAVKDDDEIELIREATALCTAGVSALRAGALPGRSELEVWAEVQAAIETAAGARTSILTDFISGPRTAAIEGPPTDRLLESGDLLMCDLVPRFAGYFGDSCVTVAVGGDCSLDAVEHHARVLAVLEQLSELVRPGTRACDLDAAGRNVLNYPHHTGHGLGASWHEQPRIVPGADVMLEPGMVIALEPALYAGRMGIRLEQVFLVTQAGHEVLSQHTLGL